MFRKRSLNYDLYLLKDAILCICIYIACALLLRGHLAALIDCRHLLVGRLVSQTDMLFYRKLLRLRNRLGIELKSFSLLQLLGLSYYRFADRYALVVSNLAALGSNMDNL